jgi:isopropylmalate/homocitrate/citramalate synthase
MVNQLRSLENLFKDMETRGVATSLYNARYCSKPVLYDTTLRDGEQTPGVSFNVEGKVEIALLLEECGVEEIEAGFPAISSDEEEAVRSVSKAVSKSKVLCLCRALKSDVDLALKCNVDGVIIFAPSSDIHLRWRLKMSVERVLNCALETIEYAKSHGIFVQFTCEDATRTPLERLLKFYGSAIERGADRIGVADTVGCITPSGMKSLIGELSKSLSKPIAVHCHNDFGLATANTLAAYEAGATALSVSVNGLGERCGNAPLEEVALALHCLYRVDPGIDFKKLIKLSQRVAELSKLKPWPLKPIVGLHAFMHESGIHVAAVLENPFTYEAYSPSIVGRERIIKFGKHSGIKAITYALRTLGLDASSELAREVLEGVKRLEEVKGPLDLEDVKEVALKVMEAKRR